VSKKLAFLALWFFVPCSNAQRVSIGVVGGAALTDAFPQQTYSTSGPFVGIRTYSPFKDYVVGARVLVRVTDRWSLLADGLYREMQGTWAALLDDGTLNSVSPSPVVTWEIPVLARYSLGGRRMRPFLEAGPSFRAIGNRNSDPSAYGLTTGAGVQLRAGWFSIAPQVRYTRWAADSEQRSRTGRNQVEVLLGLTTCNETDLREPFRGRISIGATIGSNLVGDYYSGPPTTNEYGAVTVTSQFLPGPRSIMGGPTIEVPTRPVSFEVSFLRPVLHSTTRSQWGDGKSGSSTSATGVWEIPVLAKYRLGGRFRGTAWRPLLEAGPAFRQGSYLRHFGAAAGAGMERRIGPLTIAPGVRYTKWQREFGMVPNEIAILLGVRY
jgi:hypothetical protein